MIKLIQAALLILTTVVQIHAAAFSTGTYNALGGDAQNDNMAEALVVLNPLLEASKTGVYRAVVKSGNGSAVWIGNSASKSYFITAAHLVNAATTNIMTTYGGTTINPVAGSVFHTLTDNSEDFGLLEYNAVLDPALFGGESPILMDSNLVDNYLGVETSAVGYGYLTLGIGPNSGDAGQDVGRTRMLSYANITGYDPSTTLRTLSEVSGTYDAAKPHAGVTTGGDSGGGVFIDIAGTKVLVGAVSAGNWRTTMVYSNLYEHKAYIDSIVPAGVVTWFSDAPDTTPPNPDPMTWAVAPWAGADALVAYEPFDYTSGDNLTGNGGSGFDQAWTTYRNSTSGSFFEIASTGIGFTDASSNTLPVSGKSATRTNAANRAEANRLLSASARNALLADGTTTWFSVLHERSAGWEDCAFVFGSGTYNVDNGWDLDEYTGKGFGFGTDADASINKISAIGYDNSAGLTKVDSSVSATSTLLIAGKIEWGANGSNDTLYLYNVTDLTTEPTAAIATVSLDLNQADFDRVTIYSNQANASYDEIRLGTSFTSVVGNSNSGSTSDDTISMTATTATDASDVEYYFTETSGNPGGDDSGWQDSPVYVDTGLQPGTEYTYTVTARDKSAQQHTTAPSVPASATTTGTNPNHYVTYEAGSNGSITGTATQVIAHNGSTTAVTATPNAGYEFVNWSDGSTANPRSDTNVTSDQTYTANFAAAVTAVNAVPHAWLTAQDPSWTSGFETLQATDHDGDGVTTGDEYWAGTDPNDKDSVLALAISLENGVLTLEWNQHNPAAELPDLRLESCTDLRSTPWDSVEEMPRTHGVMTWTKTDPLPGAGTRIFYRLVAPKAP